MRVQQIKTNAEFGDLDIGETFLTDGDVFLKTDNVNEHLGQPEDCDGTEDDATVYHANAVKLKDGQTRWFDDDELVLRKRFAVVEDE